MLPIFSFFGGQGAPILLRDVVVPPRLWQHGRERHVARLDVQKVFAESKIFVVYTSLDRIDIVIKPDSTGRKGYILTDHRTPEEVQSEPELSVLFAFTRIIAATRMGERESGCSVQYVCQHRPPAFLQEAIAAAGARISFLKDDLPSPGALRPVGDIADEAFRGLAERVRQRLKGEMSEALLSQLEDVILLHTPKAQKDEGAYWAAVHELAAVTGELLRVRSGGHWVVAPDRDSLLPFVFAVPNASFNVVDKARRFVDQGEGQRPIQMLRSAEDLGRPEGPLMPNLKADDFPRAEIVWRELLAGKASDGRGFPFVAVGRDQPNTFGYLQASKTPDAAVVFDEALANLARLDLPVAEAEVAGLKFLAVSGHFYASEKILDKAFLQALHRRLASELLAAAIPHKGLLLITSAAVPPLVSKFVLLAEAEYRRAKGAPTLTPVVFLISGGNVVGHVDGKPVNTEPPTKKGVWSRLFGKEN
jgi:hypothetical protein